MKKRLTPGFDGTAARGALMAAAFIAPNSLRLHGKSDIEAGQKLARHGFLERVAKDTYRITRKGNDWLRDYVDRPALAGMAPFRKNPTSKRHDSLEAFSRGSLGQRVYSEVFRSASGVLNVSLIQLPGTPARYDLHVQPVGDKLYPIGPLTKAQAKAKLKKLRSVLQR